MARYILNDRYAFRGYKGLPYGILDFARGTTFFMNEPAYALALSCNGKVELDASEKQDMANKALSDDVETDMTSGKYGFKAEGTVPSGNNTNVLIIVFVSVGGAAIIIAVAILVMNTVKAKKEENKKSKKGSGKKKTSGSTKKSSKS